MGPRRRPARAAILGGCLLVVATGCAAADAEPSFDRATGAVLADGADRLAEALEAEDTCRALLEAEALRERAARALEAGDAPDDVVAETTRVVDATTFALTCEVETAADEAADADGADEADAADGNEGNDGNDGNDEGDVSASQEPAPAPAPPPADDTDEPEPEGSGGPNGPSQGQGPDGDGPPGHRDGRGRG